MTQGLRIVCGASIAALVCGCPPRPRTGPEGPSAAPSADAVELAEPAPPGAEGDASGAADASGFAASDGATSATAGFPTGPFSFDGLWTPGPRTLVRSEGGGTIVTSDEQGLVLRVWDEASGELRASVVHRDADHPVLLFATSPDGRLLATVQRSGPLRIWDVSTGTVQAEIPDAGAYERKYALRFSDDGKQVGGVSDEGRLRLWDATTGSPPEGFDDALAATCCGAEEQHVGVAGRAEVLVRRCVDRSIYLHRIATGELLSIVQCPNCDVENVRLNADGRLLVLRVERNDTLLQVRETATGRLRARLEIPAPVDRGCTGGADPLGVFEIDPTGRTVAAGGNTGATYVWDVESAQLLPSSDLIESDCTPPTEEEQWNLEYEADFPEFHPPYRRTAIAFSPDGLVVVAAANRTAWSREIRRSLQAWRVDSRDRLWSNGLSLDGGEVEAAVGRDEDLRNFSSGLRCRSIHADEEGHPEQLLFSPDGSRVATGPWFALVNADTGEWVEPTPSPPRHERLIAFTPQGVLTSSPDGDFRRRDGTTGKVVGGSRREAIGETGFSALYFDVSRGRLLIKGLHGVDRLDLDTGEISGTSPADEPCLESRPFWPFVIDGRTAVSSQAATIRACALSTGEPRYRTVSGIFANAARLVLSPDGTTLAALFDVQTAAFGGTAVRIWDLATLQVRGPLDYDPRVRLFAVAVHPEGSQVALGGAGGTAGIWDVATGRLRRRLEHPAGEGSAPAGDIRAVAFSPDGEGLAVAGPGAEVELWDVATGRPVRGFGGHEADARAVAFSSDGRLLASAGADHTLRLWDVATGEPADVLVAPGPLATVAFAADGAFVAAAGSAGLDLIRLADRAHLHVVFVVGFPPGGGLVESAGAPSGTELVSLREFETGDDLRTTGLHATLLAANRPGTAFVGGFEEQGATLVRSTNDLRMTIATGERGWFAYTDDGAWDASEPAAVSRLPVSCQPAGGAAPVEASFCGPLGEASRQAGLLREFVTGARAGAGREAP